VPVFYFHVCNGSGFVEDEQGTDVADVSAAREHAINGLRDLMAQEMRVGQLNVASFVEIEDQNHQLVMTVPFIEAVNVSTQHGKRPPK
jgi:hypothetical protein